MKVSSSLNSLPTADAPRVGRKTSDAGSSGDEAVQISDASSSLSAASSSGSPVNQSKIDELKQAILNGQFQINPEAIADRVIASARELVASNS